MSRKKPIVQSGKEEQQQRSGQQTGIWEWVKERKFYFVYGLIVVLIISILDVFGSFRFLIPKDKAHELISFHPYYNHGFVASDSGKIQYRNYPPPMCYTNNLGWLDKSIRIVSPDTGIQRIAISGDSFMQSVGLPWDSGFVGRLAAKNPHIEFLNAGVASMSVKTSYLRLKYAIEEQHIKITEVYEFPDYSDISDALIYQDFIPQLKWTGIRGVQENTIKWLKSRSLLGRFFIEEWYFGIVIPKFVKKNHLTDEEGFIYFEKSSNKFNEQTNGLFHYLRLYWAYLDIMKTAPDGRDLSPLIPGRNIAVNLFRQDLDTFAAYCASQHIKLHFVVYPQGSQLVNSKLGVAADHKYYINTIASTAHDWNVDFINLYDCFFSYDKDGNLDAGDNLITKNSEFLPGDDHFGPLANQRMADSIDHHIHLPVE